MMKPNTCTIVFSLLVVSCPFVFAQDPEPASEESATMEAEVVSNSNSAELAPEMSPATELGETLASSNQSGYQAATSLPPGICLVVDQLVRDFCNANPDDISCQFQ